MVAKNIPYTELAQHWKTVYSLSINRININVLKEWKLSHKLQESILNNEFMTAKFPILKLKHLGAFLLLSSSTNHIWNNLKKANSNQISCNVAEI